MDFLDFNHKLQFECHHLHRNLDTCPFHIRSDKSLHTRQRLIYPSYYNIVVVEKVRSGIDILDHSVTEFLLSTTSGQDIRSIY